MDNTAQEKAHWILDQMLGMIGYEYKLESSVKDDEIYLHIESPEAGRLIGRRAQMVQSIQLLVNRILQRQLDENAPRCVVDVENYRQRRSDELEQKALQVAEEAKQTGRPVKMQAMNAFDRRTIHRVLSSDDGVETESLPSKDSRWKSIVVTPVFEESDDSEPDEYDGYDGYEATDDQDGDEQPLQNTL